jgi:hypothetical protein
MTNQNDQSRQQNPSGRQDQQKSGQQTGQQQGQHGSQNPGTQKPGSMGHRDQDNKDENRTR